jgi:hypothetical protein
METVSLITICIGFGFVWFVTLVHPPTHRILREKKTYNMLFYFSILSPLFSIIAYNIEMSLKRKEVLFMSLYLLFFLLMYKYFDNYILKKYQRNLYFKKKYNSVWHDQESDEVESIEEWFQFGLTILPLILCYILKYLIIDQFLNQY